MSISGESLGTPHVGESENEHLRAKTFSDMGDNLNIFIKCTKQSGTQNLNYGHRGSAADYATSLYPQKLALLRRQAAGRSVGDSDHGVFPTKQ
jgi:hypothetical protein